MHFMFDIRPEISSTLKFSLNIFNLLLKQTNNKPYILFKEVERNCSRPMSPFGRSGFSQAIDLNDR